MLKSPINYYGGKYYMRKFILEYIPPHDYYVEPFGGAAWILFAKEPAPFEVYNDINSDVVNFFRVLRDNFEELYHKCFFTPYSREHFYYCRENYQTHQNSIERAYMFWCVNIMGFSGRQISSSWSFSTGSTTNNMPRTCSRIHHKVELLSSAANRLKKVQIEHLHWKDCLDKYDNPDGFYYLDPPYVTNTRRGKQVYNNEMTDDEHKELIDYVLTHKRNWMISGYDNPIYNQLERYGWTKKTKIVTPRGVATTSKTKRGTGALKDQKRVECIWFNYSLDK